MGWLILSNIVLAMVVLLCNGLFIFVFYRCRRLIAPFRLILLLVTAHTFSSSATYMIIMLFELLAGGTNILCAFKFALWTGYRIVPVVFTTFFSVDRFISVTWPFWHQRICTRRWTVQWTVSICLTLTLVIYIFIGLSYNEEIFLKTGECKISLQINDFGVGIQIAIFFTSILLTTVSYSFIVYQSERYMNASNTSMTTLYDTFRMSCLICGITVILYLISIASFIISVICLHEKSNTTLSNLDHACALLYTIAITVNPLVCILRFRECRFQAMKILCICNQPFLRKAERMETKLRLKHAGIPLPQRSKAIQSRRNTVYDNMQPEMTSCSFSLGRFSDNEFQTVDMIEAVEHM